ncbi:hypothetical protein FB45DRAFT_1063863 [Roridomyces roridus]|uniref:Uncharacterized protein n=1 Tax=Roridomyces roridus TaxID=1738132 RepID=A0AAD7FFN3_9AGAR|nr:hypothetical protein FB45DRAFT_1063863 [Roridomyces roridus]
MTDLTYCYLHMSVYDLAVLDTLETPDFLKGDLGEVDDLNIPTHLVPPDPDDSDLLPSKAHPSYPYGNPTNVKHPAAKPRPPYDPSSRALFEDMGYDGGGVNGALRWRDLGLEYLLPVDEEAEEVKKSLEARKMASGATNQTAPQPTPGPADQTVDEEDEEEDEDEDEDENDENSQDRIGEEDEDDDDDDDEDEDD